MAVSTPAASSAPDAVAQSRGGPAGAFARRPRPAAASVLIATLVAACAYAAFARGAIAISDEWRLQIGLAVVALAALATRISGARLAMATSRAGWWGLGLLGAFAGWSAVTVTYSVAADLSWASTNRAVTYGLVVALALAAGSSASRAIERTAVGVLAVAVAVALYALGGKVAPGVHLGPIDLDHTTLFSRLRAPLGYWNALALVCVLGTGVAARVTTDVAASLRVRLVGLAALWLLVLVTCLTYSRGGLLALVTTVVVLTLLGGARLRGLLAFAAASAAAVPGLAFAFSRVALKDDGVALAARSHDGRLLGLVLVVSLAALLAVGFGLLRAEARIGWTPARSRRTWRALGALAGALVVLAVIGTAASQRGLTGSVSHAWDTFTTPKQAPSVQDPSRLLSSNSSNRWVWWKEAAGMVSDRPAGGFGAGSFPVTHLRYRQQTLAVRQPHDVPLQFLAETGIVGAVLALAGLLALVAAALARASRLTPGRERDLAVALVAAGVAWLVHGLYDWDWDIPGVTVPALLALGVVAARPATAHDRRARTANPIVAAGLALAVLTFVVSAALPAWSASKSEQALVSVRSGATPGELESAATSAELAARLDPLAVRPLFAVAAIAERRGRVLDQRRALLRAVDREPSSEEAWVRLAQVAQALADREGLLRAAQRALALDPLNETTIMLARAAVAVRTPPNASPTAPGTPLGP